MADSIKINLNTKIYKPPTRDDIAAAKEFVLQREEKARLLVTKIDEILSDAAQEIVTICYKHDIDPNKFSISSKYNEQMMEEIAKVMDDVEEEILYLIYEHSTSSTNNREHVSKLAAWMATLGRDNQNLEGTLDGYLYKFLKDIEAAVAAMAALKIPLGEAIIKAKTYLHSIYDMPEIRKSFKHSNDFSATYIKSKGIQYGAVGLSNNGSTNVTNMVKTTLQMVWMRSLVMDYKEQGAAGLYVLRGSNYPCAPCDDNCGFHPIEESYGVLPVHPSCCCYAIPIFTKDFENLTHEMTDYKQ